MMSMMKKLILFLMVLSLLACLLLCGCTPKEEERESEGDSLEVPDINTDENGETVTPNGQNSHDENGGATEPGVVSNDNPDDTTDDPADIGGASENELPIMTEAPADTTTPATTTGTTEPPATQPTDPPATQPTDPPETSGSNELPIIPINPNP